MTVQALLEYASAGFAFLSAAFWLRSAFARVPLAMKVTNLGSADLDAPKPEDDLGRLAIGLLRQSMISAVAAAFACAAAGKAGGFLVKF